MEAATNATQETGETGSELTEVVNGILGRIDSPEFRNEITKPIAEAANRLGVSKYKLQERVIALLKKITTAEYEDFAGDPHLVNELITNRNNAVSAVIKFLGYLEQQVIGGLKITDQTGIVEAKIQKMAAELVRERPAIEEIQQTVKDWVDRNYGEHSA